MIQQNQNTTRRKDQEKGGHKNVWMGTSRTKTNKEKKVLTEWPTMRETNLRQGDWENKKYLKLGCEKPRLKLSSPQMYELSKLNSRHKYITRVIISLWVKITIQWRGVLKNSSNWRTCFIFVFSEANYRHRTDYITSLKYHISLFRNHKKIILPSQNHVNSKLRSNRYSFKHTTLMYCRPIIIFCYKAYSALMIITLQTYLRKNELKWCNHATAIFHAILYLLQIII